MLNKQEDMLREHKPPPIRTIRISDFGLPDPKRDPDRHQNCITWSLSHALLLQKISSKSVHKFASNLTDRQTNRQTDRTKHITSFFGWGNNWLRVWTSGHHLQVSNGEWFLKDISSISSSSQGTQCGQVAGVASHCLDDKYTVLGAGSRLLDTINNLQMTKLNGQTSI